jgi:hypothetical protein
MVIGLQVPSEQVGKFDHIVGLGSQYRVGVIDGHALNPHAAETACGYAVVREDFELYPFFARAAHQCLRISSELFAENRANKLLIPQFLMERQAVEQRGSVADMGKKQQQQY